MAITFTGPQTKVLQARKHNLLVSAAAGSGKTAVLVERIVRMISEGDDPSDIDRLLVVTFTKAAAAQMRERIGAAIAKRIEQDPGNTHLLRQEILLHNAQITTMDSFFTFVLRNNFSDIEMDPGFRQMDQTEADLMRKDAMENFLEECYAAKDASLLICAEYFCHGAGDRELEEILETLFRQAVSHPDPAVWLQERAKDYEIKDEAGLFSSNWMQFIVLTAAEKICDLKRQYERLLSLCRLDDGPSLYIPLVMRELAAVSVLGEVPSAQEAGLCPPDQMRRIWESVLNILSMEFENMPRFSAKKYPETDPAKKESASFLRTSAKKSVEKLRERYSTFVPDRMIRSMKQMSAVTEALSDLAGRFLEYFSKAKREKNVIDFVDLEHFALRILTERKEDGSYVPRRAAMAYRQYFDEILIDEYQDSNDVQELLLRMISTEDEKKYNRFMVGDVKQSIYKFRLARPEIFMKKLSTYRKDDPEKERIDLDSNFRSRTEVLESVNDVFFRLMRGEIGGIEYTDEVSLKAGAVYPDAGMPDRYRTELLIVDGAQESVPGAVADEILLLNDRQKEALAVAGRIRELVGTLPVGNGEEGQRPCRYGDIVVLLRSGKGWNEDFRDVFERQGIPYYIESKTGYFSAKEIRSVLDLIRVLDNPMQDIPLYGVLHGFFGGFSEEEIAKIRLSLEDRDSSLYSCLLKRADPECEQDDQALSKKCRSFLSFLKKWRDKVIYLQIRELLTDLFAQTGYEEWCRALPGGEQRSANLHMLLAQAASFDEMELRGLFDFVRYIDQVHHRDVDYGEANILDENADVVRIMSIHKSKGLEFPVCIVAGTAKKHSFRSHDTTGSFLCDNDWGIGMDEWNAVTRTRAHTPRREAIADKIRRESLGEELRVLYVAMTRAKEKLILTGYLSDAAKKCGDWEKKLPVSMEPGEKLPIPLLTESESFLELLWYALATDRDSGNFAVITLGTGDLIWSEVKALTGMGLRRQELDIAGEYGGAPLPDPELEEKLGRIFSMRYAHEDLRGLYTKTSVSELKAAFLEDKEEAEGAYQLFPEPVRSPVIASFAASAAAGQKSEAGGGSEDGSDSEKAVYKNGFTGTEFGTAVHKLLELFDYEMFPDPSAVSKSDFYNWRTGLADAGRIPRSYSDDLPASGILAFLKSSLAQRMAKASAEGRLFREQSFVLGIEADKVDPAFPHGETVLVQGIIDACFIEDGEWVLVDYKTDHVLNGEELIKRYQVQLDLYERALTQITGKKVREKLIYSVSLHKMIAL